jgi:ubiquinone/menaquinone biosynthesis C-methylase UbiE
VLNLPVPSHSFELVVIHQVLHFLDEPAAAIAEAAAALAPGGRLLIIDFAPHELENLRQSQAHRRLGFARGQMSQWIGAAGLKLASAEDLAPSAGSRGLTVTIWSARDRRSAKPARGEKAARTVKAEAL